MRHGVLGSVGCVAIVSASHGLAQEPGLTERVDACLRRARPALLHHLQTAQGDELALVVLAAVHDRVPRDAPEFQRAVKTLERQHLGVYAIALRLMVMAYLPDFPDRERAAARDTKELLKRQHRGGGFRYQPSPRDFDFSVTQYAVLGLRAAEYVGVEVDIRSWRKIAGCALRGQRGDGGFAYGASGRSTASMTVAGIAILELCQARLRKADIETGKLDARLEKAWRWMDDHADVVGNDRTGRNLYFHYGLERACILSNRAQVGGRDWYRAGAEMLFEQQSKSGGFFGTRADRRKVTPETRYGRPVDTAFAILFLRRSFQREITPRGTTGPTTPGTNPYCCGLPETADAKAERRAALVDVERGMKAMPDLVTALSSEIAPQRRAAARAIILLTGDDFGYHPARSAEDNAAALERLEAWRRAHGDLADDGGR